MDFYNRNQLEDFGIAYLQHLIIECDSRELDYWNEFDSACRERNLAEFPEVLTLGLFKNTQKILAATQKEDIAFNDIISLRKYRAQIGEIMAQKKQP